MINPMQNVEVLVDKSEDLGLCLVHIHREPGDLNDNWDIVPIHNTFIPRLPDASYGNAQSPKIQDIRICILGRRFVRYNENGWTKSQDLLYAEGKIIAQRLS